LIYFYLSKTIGVLAIPSTVVSLIVVLGLLLWVSRYAHLGKRITVVGLVLMLIGGATPLGTALLLPLENRFPQWNDARGAPDGIVVIGGVLNTYISRKRNDIAFGPSAERMIAAVDLFRRYPSMRIVFSGGNPELVSVAIPEADLALRFFEHWGVPSNDIAIDPVARNTMENAIGAKRIAAPKPGERWLLVTSAFHMPRAIGLFRVAGFPVEAYPVDWKTGGWRDLRVLPSSPIGGFARLDLAAHEWEGLLVDWIMGRTSALFPGPSQETAMP
jgi:uncharacterized SAM-binding protein YcdF (DUF218 family)